MQRPYGFKPTPKTLEEIQEDRSLRERLEALEDAHMYLTQQYESLRSHVLYGTPMPRIIPGVQ